VLFLPLCFKHKYLTNNERSFLFSFCFSRTQFNSGVINSVLGAFTTTFGSFIIPAVCYNLYYNSPERVSQMPKKSKLLDRLGGMRTVKIVNWTVAAVVAVFGVGFGGWSSVKTLVSAVDEFHLFAECYGC